MTFQFGELSIDPIALASQGNAVLGIRDSGKTYTATCLAEHLFDAGIPFIAFDPIGVWRFLRVPGAGKGYPVVVAGGQEGDLPITPETAPAIVEAAMKNRVSLVVDLFDINLSKADWRRIVCASLRVLLHGNNPHGLRHIFLEEAAEFAPQRVGPEQGQVYAEVEKLARMGGNARLGYTLINQRSEEVAKSVLELCDNLFLHRQKGRNSLTALSKWLDVGGAVGAKGIMAGLPNLPSGQCWAWLQGSDTPELLHVPAKNSLHPDRRVVHGEALPTERPVDVAAFVVQMKEAMRPPPNQGVVGKAAIRGDGIKIVDRGTFEMSNGEITRLMTEAEQRGYQRGVIEGELRGHVAGQALAFTKVRNAIDGLRVDPGGEQVVILTEISPREVGPETGTIDAIRATWAVPVPAPRVGAMPDLGGSVARKVVNATHELEVLGVPWPPRELIALMCGYSNITSKAIAGAFADLRRGEAISTRGDGRVSLTEIGRQMATTKQAPGTPDEMRQRIIGVLGSPVDKILDTLCAEYPGSMERQSLAERVGYTNVTSKAFAGAMSKLRDMGFIEASGGQVKAAEVLFP